MRAARPGPCSTRWAIQLLLAVALPSVATAQLPTVTVTATDPMASEMGPEVGTFTFTRTGSTTAALTVSYAIGGTASNGADYTIIAASIQIPPGLTTATRTITPLDDPLVEGPETVVLTISPNASYEVGSPSTDTVTIADQPAPVVSIAATDATASEAGPDPGTFTFTRLGDTTFALTVLYAIGGTAANGADYASIATSVQFPAGVSTATRTIAPVNDTLVEGPETVVLTITPHASYVVGSPSTDMVTIADQPTPVVSIAVTDATASEVGAEPGSFTFTRVGDMTFALAISYTIGGTAANGADYATIPASIQIPSGLSTATRTITPLHDALVEGPETVVLTISQNASYVVDTPDSATVTIADGTPATTTSTSSTTSSTSTIVPSTTTLTTTTTTMAITTTTLPTTTTTTAPAPPTTSSTITAPPPTTTSSTTTAPPPPTTSSTITAPPPPTTSSTTTTTDTSPATTSTTATRRPTCLSALECDDGDACTADTCDLLAGCVHTPLPVEAQAICNLDNAREILHEPPALDCTGRCRCNDLDASLDRVRRFLDAAGNAGKMRLCRNRLRRARRAAIVLEHRLERVATRACVAPRERVERLVAAVDVLAERAGALARSGFCTRP